MARKPTGKPLTLRPVRLDDDVWAECRRLGEEHGTINEGLRSVLIGGPLATSAQLASIAKQVTPRTKAVRPFRGPLLKPGEK